MRKNLILKRKAAICVSCGSKENLTVDHIKPRSKGGLSIYKNYQLLCRDCNVKKGNYYPFED